MNDRSQVGRRTFVAGLSTGLRLALLFPLKVAWAEDSPHLDVKDPAAVALGYVENVGAIDRKKYPDYVAGTNCENCLQLQGSPGAAFRPCNLFPGKWVAASGWCSGWTPEI